VIGPSTPIAHQAAVAAFEESMKLGNDGKDYAWFFLAMAHWQLGEAAKAREWYDTAVQRMGTNGKENAELIRFRAEAEKLMKNGKERKLERRIPILTADS
jgi:hypothetical protein